MKLHILSDLHLEFCTFDPAPTDADVVILAGDIAVGMAGIQWALQKFQVPVIYVPGNHEYYHADLNIRSEMHALAAGSHVHVLDDRSVTLAGVRFVGLTLWTDFDLFGAALRDQAMQATQQNIRDFHVITDQGQPFTVDRSRLLHQRSRRWLAEQLEAPVEGSNATVVVTHHAPHRGSLAQRYANDLTSAAFISNLDMLMGKAALWVHGHTHTSFDYAVAGTRVLCNPRGYVQPDGRRPPENPAFAPALIAEV